MFEIKPKNDNKTKQSIDFYTLVSLMCDGAQRFKFAKKVHKPPLSVNAINFELVLWI